MESYRMARRGTEKRWLCPPLSAPNRESEEELVAQGKDVCLELVNDVHDLIKVSGEGYRKQQASDDSQH